MDVSQKRKFSTSKLPLVSLGAKMPSKNMEHCLLVVYIATIVTVNHTEDGEIRRIVLHLREINILFFLPPYSSNKDSSTEYLRRKKDEIEKEGEV